MILVLFYGIEKTLSNFRFQCIDIEMKIMEQRINIKLRFKLGNCGSKRCNMVQQVHGNEILSHWALYHDDAFLDTALPV